MGFLRKVGRKIKKGVKKLFSSKIGAFIGSIALSMIMGPVISRAFNGIKGVFTGAAQAGTQAATTAAGTTAGTAAGTTAGTTAGTAAGTTAGTAAGTTAGTTVGTTAGTAATTGSVNIVSDTVTGSLEKLVDTSDLFVDFGSKGSVGLKGEATTAALKEKIVSSAATGPTVGQQIRQNFINLGTSTKEFATDPFGKTKEYIGEDFIPDVARSVGQQYVMGALQGEPEQPFYSKGVQQVGSMEGPQAAYMAEIQTQMPNLQATNFQQLNQSLLYGTLSPQYLMGQAQYS